MAGGVDSLGGGGSAAPVWWVLALLCAIAGGAGFAAWLRRTRRVQFATASAGSAPRAAGPLDSGRPSDDDDLPVSYRGT